MRDSKPLKNNASTSKKGPAGFTLLEIMISLGIVAVIFTLIYGTFNAVYQGAEQLEEEAEVYRLARYGFYYMANNLSMLHLQPAVSGAPPGGNLSPSLFLGEDSERQLDAGSFPNDALQFNTVSHSRTSAEAPESDRATIRYALVEDMLMQEMLLSNGRILSYEIGGPMQGLNFRYFDPKKNEWSDTWDMSEQGKPPIAVEIELILKPEGHASHRFKTWVDIPLGG